MSSSEKLTKSEHFSSILFSGVIWQKVMRCQKVWWEMRRRRKKIWENESHLFFSSLLSQEQLQKLLFFLFEIFT